MLWRSIGYGILSQAPRELSDGIIPLTAQKLVVLLFQSEANTPLLRRARFLMLRVGENPVFDRLAGCGRDSSARGLRSKQFLD